MKASLMWSAVKPSLINPADCQVQSMLSGFDFRFRLNSAQHYARHSVGFAIWRSQYRETAVPFALLRTPSVLRGSNFDLATTVVVHLRHSFLRCEKGFKS